MPIVHSIADPYDEQTLADCWSYAAEVHFNHRTGTGTIVVDTHKSKAACYAGKPPIRTVTYEITAQGQPAQYIEPRLISPAVPAVYDELGNVTTPAVPAVMSERVLSRPALPSYGALIGGNQATFAAIRDVVDAISLTQPEFADGVIDNS